MPVIPTIRVEMDGVAMIINEDDFDGDIHTRADGEEVQETAASRESFIEDATANSGSALGRGDYDQSMANAVVTEPVEIPEDWEDLHHKTIKALAKQISGEDVTDSDIAGVIILDEIARREGENDQSD